MALNAHQRHNVTSSQLSGNRLVLKIKNKTFLREPVNCIELNVGWWCRLLWGFVYYSNQTNDLIRFNQPPLPIPSHSVYSVPLIIESSFLKTLSTKGSVYEKRRLAWYTVVLPSLFGRGGDRVMVCFCETSVIQATSWIKQEEMFPPGGGDAIVPSRVGWKEPHSWDLRQPLCS